MLEVLRERYIIGKTSDNPSGWCLNAVLTVVDYRMCPRNVLCVVIVVLKGEVRVNIYAKVVQSS